MFCTIKSIAGRITVDQNMDMACSISICGRVDLGKIRPNNNIIFMSQRNWMRPSIGLAVFTAVVRKGSIGQRGCSGNGLYSGYGAGLEGPQLEGTRRLDRDKHCFATFLFTDIFKKTVTMFHR